MIQKFEEKFPDLVEIEKNPQADKVQLNHVKEMREMHERHPYFPLPKLIDTLNLIMKREYAEQIVRGEKKLEWRAYSKHYYQRMFDKDTNEYLLNNKDDKLLWKLWGNQTRPVDIIHFHNYTNSWWLDVECSYNMIIFPDKTGVDFLHSEFGSNDLDEEYEYFKDSKELPMYFMFVLGDIVGRFNI